MDRKEFLKVCGHLCIGGYGLSLAFLQSCVSSQYVKNEIDGSYLKVLKTAFTLDNHNKPIKRSYVVLRSEQLKFPVYLYKNSDTDYTALWMECSHQGAELTAHGDSLSCPAHGSEFDKNGMVTQGPAQSSLRQFKTKVDDQYVFILLA